MTSLFSGGALLGSLGYPVGALIVDSNNDGVFNHVMLVTKTFSPTRQFEIIGFL